MSWLDGISFMVSDDAKAVKNVGSAVGAVAGAAGNTAAPGGGAPPAGQGFSMSRDEMQTLLSKCKDTRELLRNGLRAANRLTEADPPGNEPASQMAINDQAKGVKATGAAYVTAYQAQLAYFTELVGRMEDALGIHETAEDNASHAITSSATGGDFG